MRVWTAQELCTTRDCLTPGCVVTARPGTQRCELHEGRADTIWELPSLRVRKGRWGDRAPKDAA